MANIVMVGNETVGITETVTVVLSPELCRNCGGQLEPTADFKCCNKCSVYYLGKRYL